MKTEYPESTLVAIYSIRNAPGPEQSPTFVIRDDARAGTGAWVVRTDGDDHWHSASELEGLYAAPDPLVAPDLPIPFTAAQLAAFMIDGIGAVLPTLYGGSWADGPDDQVLNLLGPNAGSARAALREAYAAIHEAEKQMGGRVVDVQHKAQALRSAYIEKHDEARRREGDARYDRWGNDLADRRADSKTLAFLEEAEAAERLATEKFPEWRRAIVRHLWASALHDAPILQAVLDSSEAPASDGSASETPMVGLEEPTPPSPDTLQATINDAAAPPVDHGNPHPRAASSGSESVLSHTTKTVRPRALHSAVKKAMRECDDQTDATEVWNVLHRHCVDELPPFSGVSADGRLEYTENNKKKKLRRGNFKRLLQGVLGREAR